MEKRLLFPDLSVGEIVFCSKSPMVGLHVVLDVQNRGNGTNPLICSEFIFSSLFRLVKGSKKNREFQIDASFFKKIDWNALSLFVSQNQEESGLVLKKDFEKMIAVLRKKYRLA